MKSNVVTRMIRLTCVRESYFLVDGHWSAWGEWSACGLTCGEGRQMRTRLCDNPEPRDLGTSCFGNTTETRLCKIEECCKLS